MDHQSCYHLITTPVKLLPRGSRLLRMGDVGQYAETRGNPDKLPYPAEQSKGDGALRGKPKNRKDHDYSRFLRTEIARNECCHANNHGKPDLNDQCRHYVMGESKKTQ